MGNTLQSVERAIGVVERFTPEEPRLGLAQLLARVGRGTGTVHRSRERPVSHGEYSQGACAIAAPIVGPGGQVSACMAVLGPRDRLPDSRVQQLRPRLLAAIKQVNEALSQPPAPIPRPRARQGGRRGTR